MPAPHFLIKDSKILIKSLEKNNFVAQIKNLKVFVNKNNFFNKEKMYIKEVKLNNVNFSLLRNNLTSFNNARSNKLSNKKIVINHSNIFIKNNLGETITIIKKLHLHSFLMTKNY